MAWACSFSDSSAHRSSVHALPHCRHRHRTAHRCPHRHPSWPSAATYASTTAGTSANCSARRFIASFEGRFRTAVAERSSCFDIAISKAAAAIEYPNGIATSAPSSRRWSAARTAETASASESVRTRLQQRPVAVAGAPLTHCARSCAGSFSPGFEIRAAIEHPAGVRRFVAIVVAWSRGWPHCSLGAARELGTAIITAVPGCQRCCEPRGAS